MSERLKNQNKKYRSMLIEKNVKVKDLERDLDMFKRENREQKDEVMRLVSKNKVLVSDWNVLYNESENLKKENERLRDGIVGLVKKLK